MTGFLGAVLIGAGVAALAIGLGRRAPRPHLSDEIGYRPPGMPQPLPFGAAGAAAGRILRHGSFGPRLARDLPHAGIVSAPAAFLVRLGFVAAIVALLFSAAGGLATGLVVAGLFVAATLTAIRVRARRWLIRFEDELPESLDLLAGSLEAGSSLSQAIEMVALEGRPPLSEEFERVIATTRIGEPLADALDGASERIGSRDFEWVVRGVRAQQEYGASLAGLLRTAAEFMRARGEMRREVKALTAEGRISAAILIGLPFAVAGFFWLTNPDYLRTLTESATGWAILGVSGVLMSLGVYWMSRIVKVEV